MKRFPVLAAPLLLAACAEDGGSSGLLLQDVQVGWEAEYNGRGDGLGALVPVDLMAYDVITGEATPGVLLHVWTDDVAALPVPVEGVTVLDADLLSAVGPMPDGDLGSIRDMEVWDAEHDEFVALDPADELDLRTDVGGVARMYLYVDAFPETAEGFAPVRVIVTLGQEGSKRDVDGLFWLAPR